MWLCSDDWKCVNLYKSYIWEADFDSNSIIDYNGAIWIRFKLLNNNNWTKHIENINRVSESEEVLVVWQDAFSTEEHESLNLHSTIPKPTY